MDDIGSMVGDVASGAMGVLGGESQNASAQEMQTQAEQFDETMSSTQYQRGMADMKAAGLNPMLAYMQGGDSAPTAPTYQPINVMTTAASSAQDMGNNYQNYSEKKQKLVGEGNEATANASSAQTSAETKKSTQAATIAASASDAAKKKADATSAQVEASVSKAGEASRKAVAPYTPYIDAGSKAAQGASSAIDAVNIFRGLKALKNAIPKGYTDKGSEIMNNKTGELIKKY